MENLILNYFENESVNNPDIEITLLSEIKTKILKDYILW